MVMGRTREACLATAQAAVAIVDVDSGVGAEVL